MGSRNKKKMKKKNRLHDPENLIKCDNTVVMRLPEREKRKQKNVLT